MIMSMGQGVGYPVFIIFPTSILSGCLFLVTVSTQSSILNRSHSLVLDISCNYQFHTAMWTI